MVSVSTSVEVPAWLVAVRSTVKVPAVVGVPEMVPARGPVALKARPLALVRPSTRSLGAG
jgi:hypothetical protein